jgi:hypothetical protein
MPFALLLYHSIMNISPVISPRQRISSSQNKFHRVYNPELGTINAVS